MYRAIGRQLDLACLRVLYLDGGSLRE